MPVGQRDIKKKGDKSMARTNSLTNFLTDVADAIKEKKGDPTDIPASNFDTEIMNLPSQGTYQQKQITIIANETQNVTPDQGYDALSQVQVITQVPQQQLQTKNYTFTQNATMELEPDTGYDGFSKVGVTVSVSGGIDPSDATATANDILASKTAYISGGKVTGLMTNNGTLSYTPTSSQQSIPAGYTSGGTIAPMDITTSTEYSQCLAKTMVILE